MAKDTVDELSWPGKRLRGSPSLIAEECQPALFGNDTPEFSYPRICPSLARIPAMLFSLGMLTISPAFGQQIDSTDPANASYTVPLETNVSATASAPVTGAPAGSFVVFRSQTARTAIDALASDSTVVTLDPSGDFHPGEVIQATITDDVTAPTAVTPYAWSFRTRVVVDGDDFVNGPGDLLLISPTATLNPGFAVEPDGKLTVISADPSLPPP